MCPEIQVALMTQVERQQLLISGFKVAAEFIQRTENVPPLSDSTNSEFQDLVPQIIFQ